jgi:2-oxoglutarate/2-oxoacid ferredoxin oxidoreductase subunit alpha
MDYTIIVAGEAGQGIQTIGGALAKTFSRAGFHVFTHQDYESRVRGGHNFYQVRVSEDPVTASRSGIDVLVALNEESLDRHSRQLEDGGVVIYDGPAPGVTIESGTFLDIPLERIALEQGGSKVMANAVATGAVMGVLGMDPGPLPGVLERTLGGKGSGVIEGNVKAAQAGYAYGSRECARCAFELARPGDAKMLIQGNDAIAFGAAASGCRFYSAYPMTPSTGIMNYLASKSEDYGILVEQAEDEIAAINMALGASYAGVRSMTGTSGGGFALMVEGLSLAAMTETPVVIVLAQRPGPATGFPTRTEQGELLFALHAAHGEFPRAVFAPGDPRQAFTLTAKAFELAERYQVPAIILTDQYLADSEWTCDGLDLDAADHSDHRLRGDRLRDLPSYRRHAFTPGGISPLAVPGASRHLVVTDSDEHDEDGHIVEDSTTRVRMVEKRLLEKLPPLREEIQPPLHYGPADPEVVVACWGSTYGCVREAVDRLSPDIDIAMLHFSQIYPFPHSGKHGFMDTLARARLSVCVENNATGQFRRLVRAETGFEFGAGLGKYDGRPFTLDDILGGLRDLI